MGSYDRHLPAPDVIVINSLYKTFVIRKDNSLKERIVSLGRPGRTHQKSLDALKSISLSIPAGTTVGLMGPNGSGKSTLLKLIGGIIEPSSGEVHRRGRVAGLLELGAGFHPDLSGRDNVYLNASILGLSKEETDAQFENIVAFSEIGGFIDTEVKFYSSGMYLRLAFAVAVHTNPDILLVDEVLSVGDEAFQRKCLAKIRQFQEDGCTIILVSHSVSQVMEICDRGIVLSGGEVAFIGPVADATKTYRQILDGRRRQGSPTSELVELPLSRVIGVRLLDTNGQPVQDIVTCSDVVVQISLFHERPQKAWYTSFSIDTPSGQQVYGTSVKRLTSAPHPPVDSGEMTIEYRVDGLALAGGQYLVTADVSDAGNVRMDALWEGARFYVPENERQTGTVHAEARLV